MQFLLHSKRENSRIKIRRQHNNQIFRNRRLLFPLQTSQNYQIIKLPKTSKIIDLYKKSLKNNNLIKQLQSGLLEFIDNQWQKDNQLFFMAILGNLLLDELPLTYIQQIYNISKEHVSLIMTNELHCQIFSFFISSLFKRYESFDEEQKNEMQQKFLGVIFRILNSRIYKEQKKQSVELDLLESILNIFCNISQLLQLYYRVLKHIPTIIQLTKYHLKLIQNQKIHNLSIQYENICLKIYTRIFQAPYNIQKIYSPLSNPINKLIQYYISTYLNHIQENHQINLLIQMLQQIIVENISTLQLFKNPILKQKILKYLLILPQKFCLCINKIVTNYVEDIQDFIPIILANIKDNLQSKNNHIKYISLESFYQIMMYGYNNRKSQYYYREFRNLGGQTLIEILFNQQKNDEQITQLIKKIYASFDLIHDFD